MESYVFSDTADTQLGKIASQWIKKHQGQSCVYPMPDGLDALGARVDLAQIAERSIDLQYLLVKDDTAALTLATALIEAAERGVRVRFLLDDLLTETPDKALLWLDSHPNIELRLFNPIARSGMPLLNFLGDFERSNRRMHNKSFTVDNQITIVGGRNIADEYFQLKDSEVFTDFDVIALGPIVQPVSNSFDQFWNHELAVPMSQLGSVTEEDYRKAQEHYTEHAPVVYSEVFQAAMASPFMQSLADGSLPLYPASAKLLSDDVEKLVNVMSERYMRLAQQLRKIFIAADDEILMISPYFIPGDDGVDLLAGLVKSGKKVSVVTNSLASTNHFVVHGAYSRYRKALLQAGIKLYEVRADAAHEMEGVGEGTKKFTLHTKAYFIDHNKMFVGSLNLDPRSIVINSEMGLLINSAGMVSDITDKFQGNLEGSTYELRLNADGNIRWHALIDGSEVVETTEPQASLRLRFLTWISRIVPESQL